MIAYVSIPMSWFRLLTPALAETWDIQFIGPAGTIQKLPPVLHDIEELLGERVYVGFDWLWLGGEPVTQPSVEYIKTKLTEFVVTLRDAYGSKK